MKILLSSLSLAVLLAACGGGHEAAHGEGTHHEDGARDEKSGAQQVEALRAAIAALQARPEQQAQQIRVQHILVSFAGVLPGVPRTREEAEALAAQLFARLKDGADFGELVVEHTDDKSSIGNSPPGSYAMTMESRRGMVPAFGDVGWRLAVGEVGVAPHDPQKSKWGWHIIKRIE